MPTRPRIWLKKCASTSSMISLTGRMKMKKEGLRALTQRLKTIRRWIAFEWCQSVNIIYPDPFSNLTTRSGLMVETRQSSRTVFWVKDSDSNWWTSFSLAWVLGNKTRTFSAFVLWKHKVAKTATLWVKLQYQKFAPKNPTQSEGGTLGRASILWQKSGEFQEENL